MGLVGLMSTRYLWPGNRSNKGLHYSQWIAMISLVGLALGTAALVVVLSVYNGLEEMTLGMFNQFNPELKVQPKEGMYLDGVLDSPHPQGARGQSRFRHPAIQCPLALPRQGGFDLDQGS